jgi:hypothetical protein
MEIVEGRMSGDLARVPSLATVKVVSSFGRVHGTARMWLLVARNSYSSSKLCDTSAASLRLKKPIIPSLWMTRDNDGQRQIGSRCRVVPKAWTTRHIPR